MEVLAATSNEDNDEIETSSNKYSKDSQDIANINKMTSKKIFHCEKCLKSFCCKYKLIAHERLHTWKRPHKCEICNKRYMRTDALKCHKRTHTGEKPYECEICDNQYSDRASLKYHKMLHTGEKPFKCDVCNKKFIQSSQMKKHKRLHTGEKPYKCDICSKRFTQRQNLNKHKRVFNVGRCNICKRKFCFQNLKKVHTKCDKCTQMLKANSNQTVEKIVLRKEHPLNKHILTERKKYKLRNTSVSLESTLINKERLFQCKVLLKRIAYESPLNKHILTEHAQHNELLQNTSVSSECTLEKEKRLVTDTTVAVDTMITDVAAVKSFDASEHKKTIASIESSTEKIVLKKEHPLNKHILTERKKYKLRSNSASLESTLINKERLFQCKILLKRIAYESPLNKHILTKHAQHNELLRNTSVSSERNLEKKERLVTDTTVAVNTMITDVAAVRSFDASEHKKTIASIESSTEKIVLKREDPLNKHIRTERKKYKLRNTSVSSESTLEKQERLVTDTTLDVNTMITDVAAVRSFDDFEHKKTIASIESSTENIVLKREDPLNKHILTERKKCKLRSTSVSSESTLEREERLVTDTTLDVNTMITDVAAVKSFDASEHKKTIASIESSTEKIVLKREDPLNKHILTERKKCKLRNSSVSSESTLVNRKRLFTDTAVAVNRMITDNAAVRSFDASERKKTVASIKSSIEIVPTIRVPCLILIKDGRK